MRHWRLREVSLKRIGINVRYREKPFANSWSAGTDRRSATRSSGAHSSSPLVLRRTCYGGTWWATVPYAIYSVLYASTSDSRWHETGHGTAFKTDWVNNIPYEIASFMVMRESTVWRWSHNRHHSDTIIVGRDPEMSSRFSCQLRSITR